MADTRSTKLLSRSPVIGCGFCLATETGIVVANDEDRQRNGSKLGAGQAGVHQNALHLVLGVDVPPVLLAADHVERRLGHVEVTFRDQARHLAVKEGHQ